MPEPPEWVPQRNVTVRAVDADAKRLQLVVRGRGADVEFGAVPAGWTIVLQAGNQPVALRVQAAGAEVTWKLQDTAPRSTITLDAACRTVVVPPRTHVSLGGSSTKIVVDASGEVTIDGEGHRYKLHTTKGPRRKVRVRGSARIVRISGQANLQVDELEHCRVDGFVGRLQARRLDATTIRSARADAAADEHLHVAATTVGPESSIAARSVAVSSDIEGPNVTVTARSIEVDGDVRGGGVLRADTIRVAGSVHGAGADATRLEASRTVAVGGDVTAATLTSDWEVAASDQRDHPGILVGATDGLDQPVPQHVDEELELQIAQQLTDSTVSDSRLQARDASILVNNVEGSLLHTAGWVCVAGVAGAAGVEVPRVLAGFRGVGVAGEIKPGNWRVRSSELVRVAGAVGVTFETTDAHVRIDDAKDCGIDAARLRLGSALDCELTVGTRLDVEDGLADGTLQLHGPGQIHGETTSSVCWYPTDGATLQLHGPAKQLHIAAPDGADTARLTKATDPPRLVLQPGTRVQGLQIGRPLHLSMHAAEDSDQPVHIDTLDLSTSVGLAASIALKADVLTVGGQVSITAEPRDAAAEAEHVMVDAGLPSTPSSATRDPRLTLHHVTAHIRATDLHNDEDGVQPALEVAGHSRLLVDLELDTVRAQCADGGCPTLEVSLHGAVHDLTGEFRIGPRLDGRVAARPTTARHRLANAWTPAWLTRRPSGVAVVRSVDRQEAPDEGQLHGVDVTQVPYGDLPNLYGLHVLTPDGEQLMHHAAEDDGDSYQRSDRAQRLRRIAAIVHASGTDGASRTAANWAAARAHHATAPGRLERGMRWLHRMVGYGQRPGPALASWLVASSAIGLLLRFLEPAACGDEHDFGDAGWDAQVLRALLLPASLLRVQTGSNDPPLFCRTWAHATTFVLVGLALAFLLVALRNYLRSPVDDPVEPAHQPR